MTSIPIHRDMPSLTMRDDDLHELELSVRRSDSVRRSAGTLYSLFYVNVTCHLPSTVTEYEAAPSQAKASQVLTTSATVKRVKAIGAPTKASDGLYA